MLLHDASTHPPAARHGIPASATIVAFSFALGVSNVALPLVALEAGYGVSDIGVLTAMSALAQLVVRATGLQPGAVGD